MTIDEIVVSEYGWMMAQSVRLCRNRADAEDLTGDVVLKILCSPGSYDPARPFRPWASVIILNTYITRFNREGLVSFQGADAVSSAVSGEDASAGAAMSDVMRALHRCRRRSSTVDCLLMFAAGYTYGEISDHFGIPAGTVRSRINYARKMIRKELGGQYVK